MNHRPHGTAMMFLFAVPAVEAALAAMVLPVCATAAE